MIHLALVALHPTAKWVLHEDNYEALEWLDTEIPKPSKKQIDDEIEKIIANYDFEQCKKKAKELIALTDWSVLPDVNLANKSDFEAYRATLRNFIVNPVADPVFPPTPEAVWG